MIAYSFPFPPIFTGLSVDDMVDDTQEKPEHQRDFEWYVSVLRRRHMYFLVSLLIGWLAVWGASWVIPPRYMSTTLILVEQPTMPKNYVEPNVTGNLQDRLQSITEQILSRTHLLSIIQKLDLYEHMRGVSTVDDKIARMRKDIDIELVRDPQNDQISAFRIYYSSYDPQIARNVTGELTDLFIKENLQTRQKESEQTTNFLQEQVANARVNLAQQEAKVRQFEGQHQGELPSQQASNLQILSGLQSQLQNEQDALNTAKQQRVYFQAMIDQYRGANGLTSSSAEIGEGTSQIFAVDRELLKLRTRLTELRTHYTDRHPDVIAAQDQVAAKEKLRQRLVAEEEKSGTSTDRPPDIVTAGVAMDPQMSAVLVQLQGQLQSNGLEIDNRDKSITSLKARIGEYQSRLNAQPIAEQQLAELTRGYEQSKQNYDELLKKESGSRMATSMEQMQQGQRFTTLDPPSLPSKPDFPDRLKFSAFGLIAGFGLGLAVVAGLEFFDDRIDTELQIRSLLPVNVMWEIPAVQSEMDLRQEKLRIALGLVTGMLVMATILGGTAFSYLRGQ